MKQGRQLEFIGQNAGKKSTRPGRPTEGWPPVTTQPSTPNRMHGTESEPRCPRQPLAESYVLVRSHRLEQMHHSGGGSCPWGRLWGTVGTQTLCAFCSVPL